MKILYVSCHSVLDQEESLLLKELGYKVDIVGYDTIVDPEPYDTIIFMHLPETLVKQWDTIKHKRVIFRSIGQMVPHQEKMLQPLVAEGLQIIRYSPRERTIGDYAGEDVLIRFYKDPDEFKDWNGNTEQVINFTQSLKQRDEFCGYDIIMKVTDGLPASIFGPGNENLGSLWGGFVSRDYQVRVLQDNRVFIYHGTWPASYTLSLMEAMMTGIPVVAVGPGLGNGTKFFNNQDTYEVHELLGHNYWSDDIDILKKYVSDFLNDYELAKEVSKIQRDRAIDLFGKDWIKKQWRKFLEG